MTITLQTINSASMTELKAFATANNIVIENDRRKKASFVESIEAFLIEGGAMEEIANEADIKNGITEDITLEELGASQVYYETILPSTVEIFTCAYPTQSVEDFIDLSIYANSPTETPQLEPVANEALNTTSIDNQASNSRPPSFNQSSSNITPMVIVLYALAMIIVPAAILVGGLCNASIKVVKAAMPVIDSGITTLLEGVVWLTEIIFGDSFDEYSDSYLEIKHLLR